MNSLLIAILTFIAYLIAYRLYGTFISDRLFTPDPDSLTPAHEFKDDVDYVPTNKHVLFGHHFTSIAGAAPIVGPAIAVIWGWLPALLWVIFGSIFMGAIHDLGTLIISSRKKGKSISEVTKDIIGTRARYLFLIVMFFLYLMVISVFALVIATLFMNYPETVFPIWMEIPTAILVGYLVYRKNANIKVASLSALLSLYIFVFIGQYIPFQMPGIIMGSPLLTWVFVLFIYAFIASLLPVWTLLQPRDFINSHQLYVGMILMFLGMLVARPEIVAPAVNTDVVGAPNWIPFLFITIACGAISGFHSGVASGTTVKQLDNEKDAKMIGYGGMLAEGMLSIFAILAATAGFASKAAWTEHYSSWSAASGLGAKVGAFVEGASTFITSIGIPEGYATAIAGVLIVSFAGTTLDSATRIQSYIIGELAEGMGFKKLSKRLPSTLIAVATAFILATINGGKGGLILWPLFGTTNQLLAGLTLLAITVYLYKAKKPILYTIIPMIFLLVMTSWAMVINIQNYLSNQNIILIAFSICILILELWMIAEAIIAFRLAKNEKLASSEVINS
ncbi:carbon starvation CstA family protein [Orenia marismortui]|uniref:carbon starvation CstA family protein n=1 Tax=Orenia marismortui TaxID=46469 RepID=UPI000381ACFE|nr:carbon starvation protein A [Orenia marismortui]